LAVHVDDSAVDPLFDPIGAGIAHPDPAVVAAAIRSRLTADAFRTASLRPAFDALARVLAGSGHPKRTLGDEGWDTTVTAGAKDADVAGPLATASTLAENFLLEYANGFIGPQLAWGRIDEATIERVLVLYTAYADLARRTPALARARTSNLLAHVWWSLEQAATGAAVAGALGRPGDSALVIAGHDTNLSNLSGLLDLSWRLPGDQPNDTPPGGALIFMLWRDPATSEATVKLRYVAQTFRQMHDAAPLTLDTPPGSVDVAIPACRSAMRDGGCPWTAFDRVIRQAVDMTSVKR
jgi:4-phytase/acid phosphatase